jgi:ribosomal-protein-alanine N-acetyltransferase
VALNVRGGEYKVEWRAGLPVITTERLILRIGDQSDIDSELQFYRENEEHLGPWFPDSGRMHLSRATMEQFVPEFRKRALHDQGYRFQLCLKSDPKRYAGVLSLSRIQRGPEQTAILGYGIAKILEGQGFMSEAVRAVVRFAFEDLDLHRLEASYSPSNDRSAALLKACGFEIEGTVRGSLLINGKWCDHVLTSLLNPDWHGVGRVEQAR